MSAWVAMSIDLPNSKGEWLARNSCQIGFFTRNTSLQTCEPRVS
jgi:hypothetical protein